MPSRVLVVRALRVAYLIAGAVLFVGVTDAQAATVGVDFKSDFPNTAVRYVAAPGERNQVVMQWSSPSMDGGSVTVDVSDPGAVIAAGIGCVSIDAHAARCGAVPGGGDPGVADATLGDQDDTLEVESTIEIFGIPSLTRADGGAGDDVLVSKLDDSTALDGGPGDDRLLGGAGSDQLNGGGGHDELDGGEGDDTLTDGDRDNGGKAARVDADVLDGGGGNDTVSYADRTRRVRVNLNRRRGNGERREGDTISNVESAIGGRGRDRLIGDHVDNELDGGPGLDRLIGRGGNDQFSDGDGRVECGTGYDIVQFPTARAALDRGCELVDQGDIGASFSAYPVRATKQSVGFAVGCPFSDEPAPCAGTLRIRQAQPPHRLLASRAFPSKEWSGQIVDVPLTPLGQRLGGRPRGVSAVVSVASDNFALIRWRIRLITAPPTAAARAR